ncbi:MAG TPA: cytochrome P450 [Rugosimonospora sp.]|nr:cytochrome P450 [Rugosimonospora sp.]
MSTPVQDDLFHRLFEAEPHGEYARLRREGPVHPIALPTGATAWLVTRYPDVRRALADPRLSKGGIVSPIGYLPGLPPEIHAGVARHMLTTDPPDHTRMRRLVAAAFTPRRVESLRPRIEQITGELLDRVAGRERFDLIDELAFPLPIRVICELIGVPPADQGSFREWSNVLVAGMAAREQLPAANRSMLGYVHGLIEAKRAEPADDLLSALIAVRDEGDQLSGPELTSTVFLLLIAGHETTVNLIGNGAYLLLTHPEQWDRLRARADELLPGAVEEFLRYESPVQTATYRVTTEEVELGGVRIPAGQPVLISLLSANRDEEQFADAGRFDVAREPGPHLAFGHGIHFCLGAPLARLEGQVAFRALLTRYPMLRLAEPDADPVWRPGTLMHGLAALPVAAH